MGLGEGVFDEIGEVGLRVLHDAIEEVLLLDDLLYAGDVLAFGVLAQGHRLAL